MERFGLCCVGVLGLCHVKFSADVGLYVSDVLIVFFLMHTRLFLICALQPQTRFIRVMRNCLVCVVCSFACWVMCFSRSDALLHMEGDESDEGNEI